jgi:predicted RNA methylase
MNEDQWQVQGSAPELYDRYLVPAMTAMWALDLAQRAAVRRGDRVLDAACGTGVVKRAEHALADTETLSTLVTDAGFEDVAIKTLVKTVRFPSADDYVRIQLSATPLAPPGHRP